ncbi:hypothetical protein DPMN_030461 [Dreissena polymorpha]|uniref:Uncharacterized protein n=1 Tax=Dreissena polymorpha TaxID=45954 RepID=A0A9D4LY79_DREPO|nr:hypothetical protein DPMN_030461 [Dreissena polymorpha]
MIKDNCVSFIAKLSAVRDQYLNKDDDLIVLDANGNNLLPTGGRSDEQKLDLKWISSALSNKTQKLYTLDVFGSHHVCVISSLGVLIGRGPFNQEPDPKKGNGDEQTDAEKENFNKQKYAERGNETKQFCCRTRHKEKEHVFVAKRIASYLILVKSRGATNCLLDILLHCVEIIQTPALH